MAAASCLINQGSSRTTNRKYKRRTILGRLYTPQKTTYNAQPGYAERGIAGYRKAKKILYLNTWRDGRAAEGAPLLREYGS